MWFEKLTGFQEETPEQVRANLSLSGNTITSKVNGKSYNCGQLETPTLAELREKVKNCNVPQGRLSLKEVVGNVQHLHADSSNAGALFQAASQFNLLEMVAPSVSPEAGIGLYEHDLTQGPACAIAAGAGTMYRNYLVEVNGQTGQTVDNQIDCLQDMGKALGNDNSRLWTMRNGYALATKEGLKEISKHIQSMNPTEREELKSTLRIGLQWDTQVTLDNCQHLVSQAYCSALPVSYSHHSSQLWASFARLVLEAAYEATLAAAILNLEKTGNNKVFLTLLGGGAFGNNPAWIFGAMRCAFQLYAHFPLEVSIVSYGRSDERVRGFIEEMNKAQNTIYHIATIEDWEAQANSTVYTNPSLQTEGFIHCSKAEQVDAVIERYFQGVEDILLLKIDTKLLDTELKYERSTGNEYYPHIYGIISKNAIVETSAISTK